MEPPRDDGARVYGPPRITLIPSEGDDEPPKLHTSRVTGQTSRFHFLRSPETWYAPARLEPPQHLDWHRRRQHKRWISGTRPEAVTGIPSELLSDVLHEQNVIASSSSTGRRPLLAIGQMTDMTRARQPKPKALLATAAGASGELLRLTAARRTEWQWNDNPDPSLRMLHVDHGDAEDVALWSLDDSPITQIKISLSIAKQEPSRYIIVQKKLCTTVLRPVYRRLPVPGLTQGADVGSLDRPSRVDPRPVLTITSAQTGGHPHADVAFNPGLDGRPEQLAFIDEAGFWTVWDMQGRVKVGSLEFDSRLRYCGHIRDGILVRLPEEPAPATTAQHGILWVGPAEPDRNHWDSALDSIDDGKTDDFGYQNYGYAGRSRALLVWNDTNLVLVKLRLSTSHNHALPLLETQADRILDVHLNPANRSQVFVLTTTRVFWLDFTSRKSNSDVGEPVILLSCAHLRTDEGDTLSMGVNHGWPALGDDAGIVSLSSPGSSDVDLFIFQLGEDADLPQFQHHKVRVPRTLENANGERPGMQTVRLAPATLFSGFPDASRSPVLQRNDRFWQLFVFDQALGLQCALVTATLARAEEVEAPMTCPELAARKQRRAQKKRRVDAIRRLAETFMVPDSFGDLDDLVRLRRVVPKQHGSDEEEEAEIGPPRWPRKWVEGMSLLASRVGVSIESSALESEHIRNGANEDAFSTVLLVQRALAEIFSDPGKTASLRTLRDYGAPFEAPPMTEQAESEWDTQFQELFDTTNQRLVVEAVVPRFLGLETNASTTLQSVTRHIKTIWDAQQISPTARLSREFALAEVAEAAMRSLYGVVVLDAETSSKFDGLRSWVPEPDGTEHDEPLRSQASPYLTPRATESLSPAPPSSRPSSRAGSSQPSRSASQERSTSAVLQRLSRLAISINTSSKPLGRAHPILSYWPATRGVPTTEYQSSVTANSVQRVAEARSRSQRAKPSRRQKRPRITGEPDTLMSSQGLPPLPPLIIPAPVPPIVMSDAPVPGGFSSPRRPEVAMTSQHVPPSSQGMGLGIMSQPVPGQHGRRPVKKKRKGGF